MQSSGEDREIPSVLFHHLSSDQSYLEVYTARNYINTGITHKDTYYYVIF